MKTQRLIICFLAATAALAQTPQKAPPKQAPAPAEPAAPSKQAAPPTLQRRDEKPPEVKPAEVAPDQPVISVKGLCPAATNPATNSAVPSTKECLITVTRAQFDNLVKSFNTSNQPLSPSARRNLGEKYVELLVFSEAGKAAGVENSATYQEVMRVLRLKTLGDLYLNQLAEQYRNPSQQEIEAYYQANQSKYEGAKVGRIYLPKNDPDPNATLELKQAYQKKVVQVLDDMQARATKGEAIDKLQKEAYAALGISAAPPNTDLNATRRGMFPPKLDQEIFSHKAGDVFRSEDGNGYLIYRVENRQPTPLDSVKDEISKELFRHNMEAKTKELNAPVHAEYDEKYFGPPAPAGAPAEQPRLPNSPR
ncbi:MAG: peptidyl-prolyl cis-trans isomerase [Acidobacteriia bacterium]|nr:peptidyl-prolyl cis-trans isomerase [Terriglobia bacterium]